MKQFFALICLFSVIVTLGCHKSSQQMPRKNAQFPKFLVGTWKAQDGNDFQWEFTFEPNGTVSSLVNFWGTRINISEGGLYENFPNPNVNSAITLGPIDVNYSAKDRSLNVKVVTDYFMLRVLEEIAEGNSVDTFSGVITEDGLIWTAEWKNYSCLINGPPLDLNNPEVKNITFFKVKNKD